MFTGQKGVFQKFSKQHGACGRVRLGLSDHVRGKASGCGVVDRPCKGELEKKSRGARIDIRTLQKPR